MHSGKRRPWSRKVRRRTESIRTARRQYRRQLTGGHGPAARWRESSSLARNAASPRVRRLPASVLPLRRATSTQIELTVCSRQVSGRIDQDNDAARVSPSHSLSEPFNVRFDARPGAVEKVSHRGRGMGKGDLSLTDVILVV